MRSATACGCNHSLAVICGIFASIGAAALLAERRCLDAGGRLSDVAWSCESASGALGSLWHFVTPGALAWVALLVGIPVYVAVSFIGRRWIFKYGKGHG